MKPYSFVRNIQRLGATVLVCFSFIFEGKAQTEALKLSSSEVDFGKIAAIVYPAKTVEFVNQGTGKLAILLVEKGPNVRVSYQRRFYQPGEKGFISLYYDVRNVGPFSEEIKLFTNADAEPVLLKIKGTCISVQECFPNMNNLLVRNIVVVNKNTQAPVPLAKVTFVHNHRTQNAVTLKMDKEGKAEEELPIGIYNIAANENGFEPYNTELFIPKTYPNVLIELTPKQAAPAPVPIVETPTPAESVQTPAEQKQPEIKVTSGDLPEDKYAANNIVLLLDVSGSMNAQGKFRLLQQSVNNLVMILRPIDYVSVITYSSTSKVVLPGIPGNEKDEITKVIEDLTPTGSTQGVKGLNTAYELATQKFIKGGNNQIILATDGEFSEKNVTDEYYEKFITDYSGKGIKLSILGFGINKEAITRMKKMTTYGKGSYIHVESEKFVKNALINEIKTMSFMEGSDQEK
jgi:Mg-chelatase subunit ChlD